MRVKWYGTLYKGHTENDIPIIETDYSRRFEGKVVGIIPIEYNYYTQCGAEFVVLLDDNTFTEVPISLCERIDD